MRYITLFFLLLAGCATQSYNYAAINPAAKPEDRKTNEAIYQTPATTPSTTSKGSVRVRSLGLVDLRKKGERQRVPALYVRMVVSNTSGAGPWRVDPKNQAAQFPNDGQTAPAYASSEGSADAVLEVKPGELRAIDLFFPTPDHASVDPDVPEFDVKWVVQTDTGVVNDTTIFERVHSQEGYYRSAYPYDYPYNTWGMGFGPMWWYGSGPSDWSSQMRVRK